MRPWDRFRYENAPKTQKAPRTFGTFPIGKIAFVTPESNEEWSFFTRPLHSQCKYESIFYANRPPCPGCRAELRDHDPGDEDPVR